MPLKEKLASLSEEIAHIQNSLGSFSDIQVVLVTKTASMEQIREAYGLGFRHFAESKAQTLLEKKALLPSDIHWHLIGPLQSNKVNKVVGEVFLIHSVDSEGLAEKIAKRSSLLGIRSQILLQVNTSQEISKQGFTEEECEEAFLRIWSLPGITIKGLMTMAPLTQDQEVIRSCFRKLRLLRNTLQDKYQKSLPYLSMGMSQDYPIAIEEGATHLRIGSKVFST